MPLQIKKSKTSPFEIFSFPPLQTFFLNFFFNFQKLLVAPKSDLTERDSPSLSLSLSLSLSSQQCQRLTQTSISEYDPSKPNNALPILSHFLTLSLSLSLLRSRLLLPPSQPGEYIYIYIHSIHHKVYLYICICILISHSLGF